MSLTNDSISVLNDFSHLPGRDSEAINLGISGCLAGQAVRFNRGHSRCLLFNNQTKEVFNFIPFCPEVAAGFGTPRPAMRLTGTSDNARLVISQSTEIDVTQQLIEGFSKKMHEFRLLDGYLLKRDSPSCGLDRVKLYRPEEKQPFSKEGQGIFASALQQAYPNLPLEDEGRIHDEAIRESFIIRVFAHHDFRTQVMPNLSFAELQKYHSRYKYLLMAHNQKKVALLGRLIAGSKREELDKVAQSYFLIFMSVLGERSNPAKHSNVLFHILGHLKKLVNAEARQKIVKSILDYRKGALPRIVPVELLKHYVEQKGDPFVSSQQYLKAYPKAFGLNHIL